MATAKNRAIDLLRRQRTYERKQEELARDIGIQLALDRVDFERRSTRRSATTCSG